MAKRVIKFSKIHFEKTLDSLYNDEITLAEKIQLEKKMLLKVINFDLDINSKLKEAITVYNELKESKDIRLDTSIINNFVNYDLNLEPDVKWNFGNIVEGKEFIFGKIGKIHKSSISILDPEKKGFKEEYRDNAAIANFYIDIRKHMIAYESRSHVGNIAPLHLLEILFNTVHYKKETISIDVIPDQRDLFERIEKLEIIRSIHLNLKPPNPDGSEMIEDMKDYLKKRNAGNYNLKITSSGKMGLNFKDDPLLEGGLYMANEGNGSATVSGIYQIDGEMKSETIQSINRPVKKDIQITNKTDEQIIEIFARLCDKVKEEIIQNGRKNKNTD